jgi:hypothetical protein
MNKPKVIVLAIALLVLVLSASAAPKNEGVSAIKSKHNSTFLLKTSRKFVGATVEVVSSRGTTISSQRLAKRSMSIDFKSVEQGSYTVRVKKGKEVRVFNYLNI